MGVTRSQAGGSRFIHRGVRVSKGSERPVRRTLMWPDFNFVKSYLPSGLHGTFNTHAYYLNNNLLKDSQFRGNSGLRGTQFLTQSRKCGASALCKGRGGPCHLIQATRGCSHQITPVDRISARRFFRRRRPSPACCFRSLPSASATSCGHSAGL